MAVSVRRGPLAHEPHDQREDQIELHLDTDGPQHGVERRVQVGVGEKGERKRQVRKNVRYAFSCVRVQTPGSAAKKSSRSTDAR